MTADPSPRPFDDIRALVANMPVVDADVVRGANARQTQIAAASGELGQLADLAVWVAMWQGKNPPKIAKPQIVVFASSHGVAKHGVSADGMDETIVKIKDLTSGKSGVNQIAGSAGCGLKIVELAPEIPTADITEHAALSEKDCAATIAFGMEAVSEQPDMMGVGVVGAGATAAAGAVLFALFGGSAAFWAKSGSAVDLPKTLIAKTEAIEKALGHHHGKLTDPLDILHRLGGRDMAAVVGAILAARYQHIPVVLDGFVAAASAAILHAIDPKSIEHCVVGSVTPRDAHWALLDRIGAKPVLDLGLGLGDGSGAALAIGIIKAAVVCHNGIGVGQV